MSYILDALRRADAERERGAVPGIHAQPFGELPGDDEAPRRSRLPLWIIVGLSVALLAALAWNFLAPSARRSEGAAAPTAAPAAVAPATASPPPVAAAVPAAVPPAATPVPPPAAVQASSRTARTIEPAQAVRKPVPRKTAPTTTAAPEERAADAGGIDRGPNDRASVSAKGAEKTRGADGEKAVQAWRDLPDAVRRELPNIVVSGSTYSSSRESRMLMIGGQIFHEGDTVAKGVVLRTIKPRAAVFAYRDYLYELAF
jgi:general secretion pathway protein B